MKKIIYVLDALDDENAPGWLQCLSGAIWMAVIAGFAACCLFFAYVFGV